jgi:hypothetical protein
MRLRLFAACLIVLAACGGPTPRPTPEVMPEVAAEYGAIYNDWDEARYAALHQPETVAKWAKRADPYAGTRRHFAWLNEQLGECGAPEFMWSSGKRSARFSYPCEHGALEAHFTLDAAGHIVSLRSAAAGIPTPPALLAAADALLASLPWTWDTSRPFKHNLNLYDALMLGHCTLLRPWVVGQHGGLFHARCDKGDAVLRLGLNADGTIWLAELLPGSSYKGPPITPMNDG